MKPSDIVVKAPGKRIAPELIASIQRSVSTKLPNPLETYTLKRVNTVAVAAVEGANKEPAAKKRKVEVEVEVTLKPPTIKITIRW